MKTLKNAAIKKITAIILSACILTQLSVPSLAYSGEFLTLGYNEPGAGLSWKGLDAAQIASASEKIELAYERGESGNIYENALTLAAEEEISKVKSSFQAKAVKAARGKAQASYGNMWPMHVKVSQAKNIAWLETSMQTFLASWLKEPQIMDFNLFNRAYLNYVRQISLELGKGKTKVPYANAQKAFEGEILAAYPAKTVHKEYVKEAKAEKAWRKANRAKVEEAAYKTVRAYVESIGAQALSFESAALLKDLELNGKKAVSAQEAKQIYTYNMARLQKQNFDAFELGVLSGESKKKVARVLAKDLIESLMTAAVFSEKGDAKFLSAAENLIYRSEEGAAFGQILAASFSVILAKDGWGNLERILSRYTKQEQEGASFLEKINISYWAERAEEADGSFLGKVSQKTQYALSHSYGNIFTDLAMLLSQDGRSRSLGLLYRYGSGAKQPIKPFLAGALLSKRTGAKEAFSASAALKLANTNFGDLNAVQEYDLDKGLELRYPSIKASLGSYAVTDAAKKSAKKTRKNAFGYLKRAAFSGDIVLTLWGCAGLIKLGGKTVSLSKSAYTAVKAAKISNQAARINFIRANYQALAPYISAKRSFLRLGIKIRSGVGLKTNPVQAAKLQKDLRVKNIARLAQAKEQKALQAAQSGSAKDQAAARLADVRHEAAVLQDNFLLQNKLYGAGYDLKAASYLDKVKAWRAGRLSELPAAPVFTAGEQNYAALGGRFKAVLAQLNAAKKDYNALKWHNRTIINPLKAWWNKPAGRFEGFGIDFGEGTTIAKAFGLKGSYVEPVLGTRSAVQPLNRIGKVYDWLENHKLGFAAQGLKFVNNKATLMGTALLFNYNVATVSPAALNTGRALAQTEQVYSIGRTFAAPRLLGINPVSAPKTGGFNFSALKPADVVDPKIFSFYNGMPLISGNILQGRGVSYWAAKVKQMAQLPAAGVILPGMFLRDFYRYADARILGTAYNPSEPYFSFGRGAFASSLGFGKGLLGGSSWLLGKKDSGPKASAFIYNFLAATTVTATAPMISQVYNLDTAATNTIISFISYLPAMAVPFMGYFFKKYGVTNTAKAASAATALGVGMTIFGGLNGFTADASAAGLLTSLSGITLISLGNEIKYATMYPMIDTNFDTQKALSLTTQTAMARSAGTILFLEFGPILNWVSQSLGLGEVNSAVTFPLLLAPLSLMAVRSIFKGNYKDVPIPESKGDNGLKALAQMFLKDKDARKAALAFAMIEAGELTTSLLVFSLAQEHYGVLSDMPNILGGVLIYAAMGAARLICGELQKRGILSSNSTYKISGALAAGGLSALALGGMSPLGLAGAAMFFIGDANLFPPLLNATLKGRGEKAANTTLLIFSFSSAAAIGGTVLSLAGNILGSLQAAVLVPFMFTGGAMILGKSLFKNKTAAEETPVASHSFDLETSVVYINGEDGDPSAGAEARKESAKAPQTGEDKTAKSK